MERRFAVSFFFFATVLPIHRKVFTAGAVECPRIFKGGKADKRPNKIAYEETHIAKVRLQMMRDINKMNQHIANISNRNADELILRPFVEWCAIAQTALEMQPKKKERSTDSFVSSKRK